jgi:hypothetical protein
VKPSPTIVFNIANVIASYAFAMRYFNGEVDPIEGTVYLLSICGNMNSNANYEDLVTAVETVAQKCLQVQKENRALTASLSIRQKPNFT